MSEITEIDLHSFLKLGYFITYPGVKVPLDYSGINRVHFACCDQQELISEGIRALRSSFEQRFVPGRRNVVPLSGGLDSRLVLACLLELTEASNILTFTYGIPGSYDFEIGRSVAEIAGVKHVPVSLARHCYSKRELLDVAEVSRGHAILFYNPPINEIRDICGSGIVWSGYIGDAVAGSHLHDPPSETILDAKHAYLTRRRAVWSVRLHRCSDDRFIPHVGGGRLPAKLLSFDEQVLFEEGVNKLTAAHVLWEGFEYETPLVNSPWMDFMLSAPDSLRLRQRLMIDIGFAAFSRLFSLPSKNRLGHTFSTPDVTVKATLWLNRARKVAHQLFPAVNYPPVQYNDLNEGIRRNPSLRQVVRDSIQDLRRRGICDWVDFDDIWRRHDRRLRNHGDALVALASLELLLQARDSKKVACAGQPVNRSE